MNVTQNLLHYCALGDLKGIKALKIENDVEMDIGDYDGRTALHLACSENHLRIVEYLIKNGVKNINPIDRWGNTPLDDAFRDNFGQIIEFMIKNGAKTGKDMK